jgi:choline kinase
LEWAAVSGKTDVFRMKNKLAFLSSSIYDVTYSIMDEEGNILGSGTINDGVAAGETKNVTIDNLTSCLSSLISKITFLHNADYEHNNNIYSLWMAGEKVRGKDFLLMDSDILCDPAAVVCIAQQKGSALAVNRHELGEE